MVDCAYDTDVKTNIVAANKILLNFNIISPYIVWPYLTKHFVNLYINYAYKYEFLSQLSMKTLKKAINVKKNFLKNNLQ